MEGVRGRNCSKRIYRGFTEFDLLTKFVEQLISETLKISRSNNFRRQEDNIRTYLSKTGWEDVDWIQLAEDRDRWQDRVNTVLNLPVHKSPGISCQAE
jgi:hypothetical protein